MKAVVVYDTFYGNTERVARAVGDALAARGAVEVLRVGDVRAETWTGADVVVVGSPTRAFRATPAVARLLKGIPAGALSGVRVAAFDTRVAAADPQVPGVLRAFMRLFGYAAEKIAKRLVHKGGTLGLPPQGFIVEGSEGPLREGELERAAAWAEQLVAPL